MSRTAFRGPKLPKELLDQVGDAGGGRHKGELSRKDRRKAERQQQKKKQSSRSRPQSSRALPKALKHSARPQLQQQFSEEDDSSAEDRTRRNSATKTNAPTTAQPPKSILKKADAPKPKPEVSYEDSDLLDDSASEGSDFSGGDYDGDLPRISRHAAKAGLADNDAEIAALEKKLGIKGKSKKSKDDDFDFLLEGLGEESEEESTSLKRKRPDDVKWLRDKRLKAAGNTSAGALDESDDSADSSSDDGFDLGTSDEDEGDSDEEDLDDEGEEDNDDGDDGLGMDEFEAFSSDDEKLSGSDNESVSKGKPQRPAARENPYVAPGSQRSLADAPKYVPPSLRKASESEEEALRQLRRQIQGQLNRLSEANILSIVQALEQIYQKNARQHVTSTLIELLMALVTDPSILNDAFLILHAAFSAAMYKVVGIDFGAQLLEQIVMRFDSYQQQQTDEGKQTLNLVAFLANLYSFQMVGSTILFDYIRTLLETLSESNTELLLRIIRVSGPQLRQDDPTSLKDIVLLLQRNVAAQGEANLSVRTKFMIETINQLKNNRMKAGVGSSALAAEHTTRMRKVIGTLNTRSTKAGEPLRITLADIRDSDKKGKWWLVGASWRDPAKLANGDAPSDERTKRVGADDLDAGYESDTPGHVSLSKLARAQGMNNDIRRAIFMSIMSASDFKDAHMRLLKLHLTSKQELEIPRVLLHCSGAEKVYNPYYTLIAQRLCSETKVRKAFQFSLWDILRRLGEQGEDDESADEGPGGSADMTVQKIVNLAKLYSSLLAHGDLSITALKPLEFSFLSPKAKTFAEVLLTTALLQFHKNNSADFGTKVTEAFAEAQAAPNIVQDLKYFIESSIARADLANGKAERRVVKKGCKAAITGLLRAAEGAPVTNDSDSVSESD